jgi:hypothetical protein
MNNNWCYFESAAHARCFRATSAIFELKMPDRTIRPVKPKDAAQGNVMRESGIVVWLINTGFWRFFGKLAGLGQKRLIMAERSRIVVCGSLHSINAKRK